MKHVKPTQEKQPVQIIIHFDTSDLLGNKNTDEIASKIIEFTNSIKTSESDVVVSSKVSRKDRFNKAKEVNEHHTSMHFLHTHFK